MKKYLIILFSFFILYGCTCKNIKAPGNESMQEKKFGAVADDPKEIAKVPILISEDSTQRFEMTVARGPGRKDRTPPTVRITSPLNAAVVTGTITIQVDASDNVAVSSVTISIDGNALETKIAPPYSFSWNTTNVIDGSHTIKATAKDPTGNTNSNSILVSKNTVIIIVPPPPDPLPTSYSLTMPPVQYQGGEGSCVAFALGYARSATIYKVTGATTYSNSTNVLSPEMLFNCIKGRDRTSCTGSALITGLIFLRDTGVCLWASMPYTDASCVLYPNAQQLAEAANYRIKSYSMIAASDIIAIKTMLAQGRALVHQVDVDQGFYSADANFIWRTKTATIGGHAICIVGYDDQRHAFKVLNQWGTSWGDAGYSWIDYDLMPQVSSPLFVMNL